jgi:hypothetical protein
VDAASHGIIARVLEHACHVRSVPREAVGRFGAAIGRVKARPEQTLGPLEVRGTSWADLSARIVSEIVRDVTVLAS